MADNINVTTGSGIAIGGDLISSVLYQRVKLIAGIDGVNDGDIAATNPLPVSVSGGTIVITQPTAASLNAVVSNGSIAILSGTTLIGTVSVTQLTAANLNAVVSNGSIALLAGTAVVGTVSVTQLTAANLNVVVSNGTILVNTASTLATSPTAANFNVVVSNGSIVVNTCSTLATSPTAANFNVVVSNGSIVVNTISTTAVTQATAANLNCVVSNGTIGLKAGTALVGTVSVTQLTAANLNVVVSNGSIVVNTISTTALVVSQATLALRPTRFRGSVTHSDSTTAITIINGAATNATLNISYYLISSSVAGNFWLEDGAATALTPKHYFAANGGAAAGPFLDCPISTAITATTIKLKGSAAGSVGCLVLGYSG
jgi:hypothetical protein